jgi:hypothetical protein
MSQQVLQAANEAVFQRQLSTNRAVQYVVGATGTDAASALAAVKQTVIFHKQ